MNARPPEMVQVFFFLLQVLSREYIMRSADLASFSAVEMVFYCLEVVF